MNEKMSWTGNNKVFKTYVKGNPSGEGKSPAEKVKGLDSIRTFADASQYECFGGILNDGFVDVSFDTKEMYDAFLDMAEANNWRCLCLPSTKGGHTYWKYSEDLKGGKDKKLAVGLMADIHSKSTYIPLRVHGTDRFPPDYDILEDEEYQELPDELLPVDTNIELWGMDAGEGRNDTLYKYILILQSQLALEPDKIRAILKNTNLFCFKDPLTEDELEVILRDEAFKKPIFFYKNSFLFDKFAIYLKNTHHFVKVDGQLYLFHDGKYTANQQVIERTMVGYISKLSVTQRKEVLQYLMIICDEVPPADARYIAFRNGIYDLESEELKAFSREIVISNIIPWDYNPNAYSELADKTLDEFACGDAAIRALLEECIGYCFYRDNKFRKAFILRGDKRNGKSTFIETIQKILGDDNITALDLKELSDRFSTALIYKKLANIGDDISSEFMADASLFKKIVSGNRIKAEYKGQKPFEFNPYIKLLFSVNDIPRIKDKTGAVLDRMIIIPFNATFPEDSENTDPNRKYKLQSQESIEYLIQLGIKGLKRILKCGFTKSVKVEKEKSEYEEYNNPIVAFFHDEEDEYVFREPVSEIYKAYCAYCVDNGFQRESPKSFGKSVRVIYGAESRPRTVRGKSVRFYEKV